MPKRYILKKIKKETTKEGIALDRTKKRKIKRYVLKKEKTPETNVSEVFPTMFSLAKERNPTAHNPQKENLRSEKIIQTFLQYCKTLSNKHENPWYKNNIPSEYILKNRANYNIRRILPRQQMIIDYLHKHYFSYGKICFVRQTKLGEILGFDKYTINKAIAFFERKGLLLRITRITPNKKIQTYILPTIPEISSFYVNTTKNFDTNLKKTYKNISEFKNPLNYYHLKNVQPWYYNKYYLGIIKDTFDCILNEFDKIIKKQVILKEKLMKKTTPCKKSIVSKKIQEPEKTKPVRYKLKKANSIQLNNSYKFKPEDLIKGWNDGNKNYSPMLTKIKDMLLYIDENNLEIDYKLTDRIIRYQNRLRKEYALTNLEQLSINDTKKYHQLAVVVTYFLNSYFNGQPEGFRITINRFINSLKNSMNFSFYKKWNLILFYTNPKNRAYEKYFFVKDDGIFKMHYFSLDKNDKKLQFTKNAWREIYIRILFEDEKVGADYYAKGCFRLNKFLDELVFKIQRWNLNLCGHYLSSSVGEKPSILEHYLLFLMDKGYGVRVKDIVAPFNWDSFVRDEMQNQQGYVNFWRPKNKKDNYGEFEE